MVTAETSCWFLKSNSGGENICRWIKSSFWILIVFSLVFVSYTALFSDQFRWRFTSCADQVIPDLTPSAFSATNISHVFFGIGGSARTWQNRRGYSELWWRNGETRGYVWLDEEPIGGAAAWPSTGPPYRVSENLTTFGQRASAARIARIVVESYRVVVASPWAEEVRWLVMGDDDTVFFTENLVEVLGKYDHRKMYYVGGMSESVEQAVIHSYGMAFGGGGFAVSLPAAAEISKVLDRCLVRYASFYGSDERIYACMGELGVPRTLEPCFHQMDIRKDPYGLLAAHPVAPLVTLHHLDYLKVIFPGKNTQLEALSKLVGAARADEARTLQQSICYDHKEKWSVSVSWGYTAQIYPWVVTPKDLATPLQTFQTWRTFQDGPFTFNTRPLSSDPCQRPMFFFLDKVEKDSKNGGTTTTTEYKKQAAEKGEKVCESANFVAASKIETVKVVASTMDPNDWKSAPRRQCCETNRTWSGKTMEVHVRKCRPGENSSPP